MAQLVVPVPACCAFSEIKMLLPSHVIEAVKKSMGRNQEFQQGIQEKQV